MIDKVGNNTATVIMAGLPRTGKTTFLAALYHVLESEDTGPIKLRHLPETRRYLQELRKRWLQVKSESRTSSSAPIVSTIDLLLEEIGAHLELSWPDLSGEHFAEMARKRTLDGDVDRLLGGGTALIFFVHPDALSQEPRIAEVERLARLVQGEQTDGGETDGVGDIGEDSKDTKEWEPDMIPAEVLTLELLQLVTGRYFADKQCKVSVVVSAWDLVDGDFSSPGKWFSANLPMLDQFLEANSGILDVKLFGVSALGGDAKTDREELLAKANQANRIRVLNSDGKIESEGILSTIKWLIE